MPDTTFVDIINEYWNATQQERWNNAFTGTVVDNGTTYRTYDTITQGTYGVGIADTIKREHSCTHLCMGPEGKTHD